MKQKLKEWIKRYLPSEIIGTLTALIGAYLALVFNGNMLFVAYAGSIAEAIGFYSTVFVQNVFYAKKKCKRENRKFLFSDLKRIVWDVTLEFGPAGLIDDLLLRPLFMYAFPLILNNFFYGILIGKFVGDFAFYVLVVISYEFRMWRKGSPLKKS